MPNPIFHDLDDFIVDDDAFDHPSYGTRFSHYELDAQLQHEVNQSQFLEQHHFPSETEHDNPLEPMIAPRALWSVRCRV